MKITKNCGKVFANIGFPPDEAANIIARATLTDNDTLVVNSDNADTLT